MRTESAPRGRRGERFPRGARPAAEPAGPSPAQCALTRGSFTPFSHAERSRRGSPARLRPGIAPAGVLKMSVGISCGVESMSRVPPGSASPHGPGRPFPDEWNVDLPNQVEVAERIARHRGLNREHADRLGLLSQGRAATAWAEERFKRETCAAQVPTTEQEQHTGQGMWRLVDRDEGLRDTSMEAPAGLQPVMPTAVHTAGN